LDQTGGQGISFGGQEKTSPSAFNDVESIQTNGKTITKARE